MKFKEKIKSINYQHYIGVGITLAFVLVAVLVFPNAFVRLWESLCDLWSSVKYYFCELFDIEHNIVPTVNDVSNIKWTPIFNLPATWEEFVVVWQQYWKIWATKSNFMAYLSYLGTLIYNASKIILLVVIPVILLSYLLFQKYMQKQNNDYDKDSKPLKFTKWLASKTYIPVKRWLKQFVDFCKDNKYFKIWLWIWLFNFNVITMFIEFLAFYFYFCVSFGFKDIYKQFYKLFCDMSVGVAFIPVWCWVILGYLILCKIRKKIGYARLNHFERKNCGFINERPIVFMTCGTMGKKKTTNITDIALSQEVMLKDKAFELLGKNDMKFPNFPWINLENVVKDAMRKHKIYNLATCRYFIARKRKRWIRKQTKENLFGYDFERYGLWYNDALTMTDVWQVIETYAQLYFIYIIQSSLIISNYSIRTDNVMNECGNFPMWDTDFFERDVEMQDETSRHAHIIDFDALRLGRKVIENNYKKDSFDFGVVVITEVGKERKNNLQLQEMKRKDETTNQKNDGFNDWLKMIRHSATVDNFPFVKVITDEQRPESWGADARDLSDIVHIRETSDKKLAMPFFSLFELIYHFVFDKFINLYYRYRFVRSDNTLPMYMLKKLASTLHNYYTRTYNTFGYFTLDIQIESGTQDGQFEERKYYLMTKKIYSKRFSTDCFSDFFATKSIKSPIGINDLTEYGTEKATFEELKEQNSYFINDLIERQNTENDGNKKV